MADDIEDIKAQKREQLQQTANTPDEPVHVESGDHLDELTADHDVVLVDFYADWCGPCQMLEPTMEEIAAETAAVVAKVDIDALQSLAGQYGVRGVPTLVLFAGGEQVEQVVGVRDKSFYVDLIERQAS
ncbi:thioredoxin [Halapricum sp. CBA1109]|uniref:thioredoxin n=1 Tax=Halapricum sp. CBA1109 TaxID=2668068 RepID=UPI0012FA4634|nr:thioredoxin [Halapricum sp. CBA1109]MUV88676.1 thioredoxin [Halapricum sp. CBA1109]